MSITYDRPSSGRLCNQIFRNIALSEIAKKHNLKTSYSNIEKINSLGLTFFCGNRVFDKTKRLTDDNYEKIREMTDIDFNLDANYNYFQTSKLSLMIYNYIQSQIIDIKNINNNSYENNDIFIHVRLGDIMENNYNLDIDYYKEALTNIQHYDNIYISSDSPDHNIVTTLIKEYNCILYDNDEVNTLLFASSRKYKILSHGTFSAIIGYLSDNNDIYFPNYDRMLVTWHGNIFMDFWNSV